MAEHNYEPAPYMGPTQYSSVSNEDTDATDPSQRKVGKAVCKYHPRGAERGLRKRIYQSLDGVQEMGRRVAGLLGRYTSSACHHNITWNTQWTHTAQLAFWYIRQRSSVYLCCHLQRRHDGTRRRMWVLSRSTDRTELTITFSYWPTEMVMVQRATTSERPHKI